MGTKLKLAAVGMGICGMLAAPAGFASAQQQSAQDVISQLHSQGYSVNVDRVGSAPMNECVVTSVRNRHIAQQWVPGGYGYGYGNNDDYNPFQSVTPTVTVSLNCT
jgi:hypothetical protein